MAGGPQVGAVHHARSRGGDRAVATASSCCRPGPATHPIGEFAIDLPRPRDVAEIRSTPRFIELHSRDLGARMREEVLKGYAQQLSKAA